MAARDYRIFVGALLEGEPAGRIQLIRQRYDPVTARITPPHVTLAGTYWRAGSPTAENEAEAIRRLETLTGILQPFDLVLGGVRTFPGEQPVVYLGVEAHTDLLETRRLLLSILGPDQHAVFHPHLTLAMRLPGEKAREMVSDLQALPWTAQPLTVPIRELRLMLRGPQDRSWRAIHQLKLADR